MSEPERPASDTNDPPLHATRITLARLSVETEGSLPKAFVHATEICARALQVERVGIWIFDASKTQIECVHLCTRSDGQHTTGEHLSLSDSPGYREAIRRLRTVAADEVHLDRRTNELFVSYFAKHSIVSTLDAAIYRGGEVAGIVCAEHVGEQRAWAHEERDFVAAVADMISLLWEQSARVAAEKALAQRETLQLESMRLEALGRLAAGVAHDSNNLLQVIIGLASKVRHAPVDEVSSVADQIIDTARRVSALNRQILSFGRPTTIVSKGTDLNATIERLRPVLSMAMQRRAQLSSISPKSRCLCRWRRPRSNSSFSTSYSTRVMRRPLAPV
ncbi:MAG: GAF domain-containing protein [Polyangiaceae bacterium]